MDVNGSNHHTTQNRNNVSNQDSTTPSSDSVVPPTDEETTEMVELAQKAIDAMKTFDSEFDSESNSIDTTNADEGSDGPDNSSNDTSEVTAYDPKLLQLLVGIRRRWGTLSREETRNKNQDGTAEEETDGLIGKNGDPNAGDIEASTPSVENPSLDFLHQMLDVQEKLICWLTKLTKSEISREHHEATYTEVMCIRIISVFHHKLLPIMQSVYKHQFPDQEPYDVFVCYTDFDEKSYAWPLVNYLEQNGARVFVPKEDLSSGKRKSIDEIMWALTTAKAVWCVASPVCVQDWHLMQAVHIAYTRFIRERENGMNSSSIQEQEAGMKFQLIMDYLETDQHNGHWERCNGMNWMDYVDKHVQSLKVCSSHSETEEWKIPEFPKMKRARAEEELNDERIKRIAGEEWSKPIVEKDRVRNIFKYTILVFVLVVILPVAVMIRFSSADPNETAGGDLSIDHGSYESSFHDKRHVCNKGGEPPGSIFPEKPHDLFGRDMEMKKLNEMLVPEGILAIVGVGGVGKSHLAAQYVNEWINDDKSKHRVYWLESASEDSLRTEYIALLERFGCWPMAGSEGGHTISNLAGLVWKQLDLISGGFEWLVVFNNAPEVLVGKEGPEALESVFFGSQPLRQWSRGRILFTTRSQEYGGETSLGHIKTLELKTLGENASISMLLNGTVGRKDNHSTGAAREVVGRFGYLPLAIVTVNSIIIDKNETVEEYLDNMGDADDVRGAITAALEDSLDYADQTGLGDVLNIVSFINPDRIPLSLMQNRTEDVDHLCKLSLLRRVEEGVYSIDRMHQEAARNGRSPLNAITALSREFEKSINTPSNEFKKFDHQNFGTWDPALRLVPHAVALETNTPREPFLEDLFHPLSEILHLSGGVLLTIEDFEKARMLYEKAIDMKWQLYGSDAKNAELASTLTGLGLAQDSVGNYTEARLSYRRALDMYYEVYGGDAKKADLALTLKSLGSLEEHTGNFEEARLKYKEAVKMYRVISVDENGKNGSVALTLSNLGDLESEDGNYESATSYYMESLEMYRGIYGGDGKSVDIANILNSLGHVAQNSGNYTKARSYFVEALEMYDDMYGNGMENVVMAKLLNALGGVEYCARNFEESVSYYEGALKMYHQIYGSDAEKVEQATILNSLRSAEEQLGDDEKARNYREEAEEIEHSIGGKDDIDGLCLR